MSNVHHPSHYNKGKFEVIEVIRDWKLGFNLGNTVKYVARAFHKGKPLEDLQKAAWYLNDEIEELKRLEAASLSGLEVRATPVDEKVAVLTKPLVGNTLYDVRMDDEMQGLLKSIVLSGDGGWFVVPGETAIVDALLSMGLVVTVSSVLSGVWVRATEAGYAEASK